MERLVLLGGGHSHLFVLEQLARTPRPELHITLLSPSRWHYYSGMLPGWMAGHYRLEQCRIDLQALAGRAGVDFVEGRAVGLDSMSRELSCSHGPSLHYDLLSVDVGSETCTDSLAGLQQRLLPIKPWQSFITAWPELLARAQNAARFRLLVAGGGAAGVELAFAAQYALKGYRQCQLLLATGSSGLLPTHGARTRKHVGRLLARAGIDVLTQRVKAFGAEVKLDDGSRLEAGHVIGATGACAPRWLRDSALMLDAEGYILVDACHRSVSDPRVFAAGDVCSRSDVALQRSGVHAVRAGPMLANNLLATLERRAPQPWCPGPRSLYLLSCGEKRAVMSWGKWSMQGRWVWQWKDRIDRAFIRRFTLDQE